MNLPIRFLPEAEEEYREAVDWYEERGKDLAKDFYARIRAAVLRVAANPRMHAKVLKDVRKAIIGRFPYILLYRESAGELIVVAVFHTSRDPREWMSRVE